MVTKLRRWVAAAVVALIASVGVSVASPAPARAALSACPLARLCLWQHLNYEGTMWVFDINAIALQPNGCLTLTPSARNIFTSLYARVGIVGSTQVRVWANTGCSGFYQAVTSNIADPNLLIDPPVAFIHDDIESISVRS